MPNPPGREAISAASESHWVKATVLFSGTRAKINLANQRLDDVQLQTWVQLAALETLLWERLRHTSVIVDVSSNAIGDDGIRALLDLLAKKQVPVEVIAAHKNVLTDDAAFRLADYILTASCSLKELHLSHNCIGANGISKILKATASAEDIDGRPKYPINGQTPLWLRLEQNAMRRDGYDPRTFLRSCEEYLHCLRLEKFPRLPADGERPMLCEAAWNQGCKPHRCCHLPFLGAIRASRAGGSSSRSGPIAHVPYLGDMQRSLKQLDEAVASSRLANPCGCASPWSRPAPAPPPIHSEGCAEAPRGASGRIESESPVSSSDRPRPAAGEEVMVRRMMCDVISLPTGFEDYDPFTFLVPLAKGDQVQVLYVGSVATGDDGWLWARAVKNQYAGWIGPEEAGFLVDVVD